MSDIMDQIREWLELEGFERGCHGTCGHGCGLPPSILVKPGYTPIDGAHTLAVTSSEVLSATCRYPSNYNDWQVRRRVTYESREDLKRIISELIVPPRGCW